MKYKDKHDIFILSTIYKEKIIYIGKVHYKTEESIMKPDILVDYNKKMILIDKSDMQGKLTVLEDL